MYRVLQGICNMRPCLTSLLHQPPPVLWKSRVSRSCHKPHIVLSRLRHRFKRQNHTFSITRFLLSASPRDHWRDVLSTFSPAIFLHWRQVTIQGLPLLFQQLRLNFLPALQTFSARRYSCAFPKYINNLDAFFFIAAISSPTSFRDDSFALRLKISFRAKAASCRSRAATVTEPATLSSIPSCYSSSEGRSIPPSAPPP